MSDDSYMDSFHPTFGDTEYERMTLLPQRDVGNTTAEELGELVFPWLGGMSRYDHALENGDDGGIQQITLNKGLKETLDRLVDDMSYLISSHKDLTRAVKCLGERIVFLEEASVRTSARTEGARVEANVIQMQSGILGDIKSTKGWTRTDNYVTLVGAILEDVVYKHRDVYMEHNSVRRSELSAFISMVTKLELDAYRPEVPNISEPVFCSLKTKLSRYPKGKSAEMINPRELIDILNDLDPVNARVLRVIIDRLKVCRKLFGPAWRDALDALSSDFLKDGIINYDPLCMTNKPTSKVQVAVQRLKYVQRVEIGKTLLRTTPSGSDPYDDDVDSCIRLKGF